MKYTEILWGRVIIGAIVLIFALFSWALALGPMTSLWEIPKQSTDPKSVGMYVVVASFATLTAVILLSKTKQHYGRVDQ